MYQHAPAQPVHPYYGMVCRFCGLAVLRDMTAKTLIGGWWGYASFFIAPFTVLINLAHRGKVANLPMPVPPMDGRPYDPGPPLMGRPIALLAS